jgi:hypothetical protein
MPAQVEWGHLPQAPYDSAPSRRACHSLPCRVRWQLTALFSGLCTTSGAVVTPQGTVQGKTATVQVIVTGTTCDWRAGTGTQDLRATVITIADQGTRP